MCDEFWDRGEPTPKSLLLSYYVDISFVNRCKIIAESHRDYLINVASVTSEDYINEAVRNYLFDQILIERETLSYLYENHISYDCFDKNLQETILAINNNRHRSGAKITKHMRSKIKKQLLCRFKTVESFLKTLKDFVCFECENRNQERGHYYS